jgi:hypothetical protein
MLGLLSVGAGLFNSMMGRKQSKDNTAATHRHNMEMAEYQYSKDLEMWNRQNAYNDPAAQMKRLEEAGLNPNLVYGSGSVAGNTGSSMPEYNAPTMDYSGQLPISIPNMIGEFQNVELKQAQIDNAKDVLSMNVHKIDQEHAKAQYDKSTLHDRVFKARMESDASVYSKDMQKAKLQEVQKKLTEKDYDII